MNRDQPVTILICALGGEGGGVLTDWLVDTAQQCGHAVQGTSIPGVAQRTGATTYYVEIFPRPDTELNGRRPLFGLYAVPGGLDLLVGTELMEAARQAGLGMVSPDRTAVVASTRRALTVVEKMALGDGRVDEARLVGALRVAARELELFDMAALAQSSGTVISAVLFGALAGYCHAGGLLPFPRSAYEQAIRRGGKGVEASLRGFGAAWDRVANAKSQRDAVLALVTPAAPTVHVPEEVGARFPAPLRERIALGHARLVEYQNVAYAELYLDRLQRLLALDSATGAPATHEAARWLALWMAFDDIVRVADLKRRASRIARVRREVKAEPDALLRVYDHFKPGVPEFAALLPKGLADALARWDRRRVAQGREPFALPLKLATHSLSGALALRLLAALKGWRRHGSRFAVEQALIDQWLAAVEQGLRRDAALGLELARCGQLIKGYGSTNERGKRNLLHIMAHLHDAGAVRAARQAALADEAGAQLDAALVRHHAPPRPVAAQPIRWHRQRPHAPATGTARSP